MKLKATDPSNPFYPDVLGAVIQHQPRIIMDGLEFAAGVFPRQSYLNQPVELVLVLQNMVDRKAQVKINIQLPKRNRQGEPLRFEIARNDISQTLGPGEVGLLRVQLMAHAQSGAGKNLPLRVNVNVKLSGKQLVRPPGGGPTPSVLSVSPFRLQALREMTFIAPPGNDSSGRVDVPLDLVKKVIPGKRPSLEVIYESLWTDERYSETLNRYDNAREDAAQLARPGATGILSVAFMDALEERYAARNLPLHPAELSAIAKMMTYTVEDAPRREAGVILENTRWFNMLSQALALDPQLIHIPREDVIVQHTFEGVLFEAVLLGFRIVEPRMKEKLGSQDERINYATRLIKWLAGDGEPDPVYIYLPLAMGGLLVAPMAGYHSSERAWDLVDGLTEAYTGRQRLAGGQMPAIFETLEKLLARERRSLEDRGIRRQS